MFPLLMLYSVHISIFSLVFVNCFRVFAISVGKGDTVCRMEGGRETSMQDTGGPGGTGQ